MSNVLYIVGGYDYNGNFKAWATRTEIGLTDNYDEAERILTCAVANNNGWISDVQIWKLDPSKLELINENNGIKDYERLKKKVRTDHLDFISEDLEKTAYVWVSWFYHRSKKLITISYNYDMYWDRNDRDKYLKELTTGLENNTRYVLVPAIKKAMKELNIDLRVEFKDRYTGRKVIRGFITKED